MINLRHKIIISTLFIIFLITAGSYFIIQDIQKNIIEVEFRDKGIIMANHLALEFTTPLLVSDILEIRSYIDNLKGSFPDIEYIYVTDSEGIVLVHTFESGFPKALQERSKPENVKKEEVIITDRGIIHEFDAPILDNIGYVHVGLSESRLRAQILDSSRNLLWVAISGLVLGSVFIYFIGRRLTEPILDLTEGAKRINNGFLDQKIRIDSRDELGMLASTFNDMASSLDRKMKDLVASKEQTETAQKYLETLFDSIDDGIIVLNIKHEIIKTNRSFQRMMGVNERDVLGKSCHELIFGIKPEHDKNDLCPIDKMIITGEPIRTVHDVDIHGSKKIMDINGSLLHDGKGEINIILVLRDVTQQKALEEEIIARNRELTVLNKVSRNISETFDLDRILSGTLETLLELTGMDRGDIYLKDEGSGELALKIHKGESENVIQDKVLQQTVRNNEVLILEDASLATIPIILKDKVFGIITLGSREPHRFSDRDKDIFTSIGNQLGVAIENIMFYNNIKYLKEFNEEILNNINLAIHVVDKDMKILAANDELVNLSRGRVKKDKIIDKNLFDVYPFLKEKNVDGEYEYVLKNKEIFQSEEKTEYYGETIYTSTSKIPVINKSGNVEKIITVMRDVTLQRRLEEELKDSYDELRLTYLKLKELYKIKESFLSGLSHELRTPLTSIVGYTELLLDQEMPSEDRHKLEIILRNSKRLSGLINELLDTTLIETRGIQLDIQPLLIHDLMVDVAEDMKATALIKNIPVHLDIPKDLVVNGDIDRLTQVFTNLLDNAIKFTIKGEINIGAKEEGECVHIKVSDTGIGIPEDKIEKIFDRFSQLDSPESNKNRGAGLGLWISKNIVEAHKGKIWAESKNSGSTFHVLLFKGKNDE